MSTPTIAPPTADLAARIAAHLPFPSVSAAPEGDGPWCALADLPATDVLATQFARLAERSSSPPEVQVTHVVGWLAAAVIAPMAVAYRTEDAVLLLDARHVHVRPDPGGWFNAIALGEPELFRGDGPRLGRVLVERVTELFEPVVAHALPHSRLGRRTVWATVSDRLVQALFPSDPADPGVREARTHLEELLTECGPLAQRRRWTSVELPRQREALAPVASACCLAYKSADGAYCARVCPKTSEDVRAAELKAFCTG